MIPIFCRVVDKMKYVHMCLLRYTDVLLGARHVSEQIIAGFDSSGEHSVFQMMSEVKFCQDKTSKMYVLRSKSMTSNFRL